MSKKSPSGLNVIKALSKMGFRFARQKGSHITLKKGNIGCTVPLHHELDKGTLDSILKQAKVDKKEFMKYLIIFLSQK